MSQSRKEVRPDHLGAGFPPSRQVSWYETYTYADRIAGSYKVDLEHLPIPGTPQWCGMPDDDARKLLALVLGGVREALNHDARQTAEAEASQDISAAADWKSFARRVQRGRGPTYIPRKAS